MLVFFFTLAGVVAGFIIGYNWRKLLADKASGRYRMARTTLIAGILLMIACLTTASVHAFSRPLINPGLGDVVLFVFAMAGAVSGFIGGNGFGWLKAEIEERRLST